MGRAMAKTQRSVPVVAIVTTGLEVVGAGLLTAAGWLAFGLAGALAVLGGFCIAGSFALTRGSR
jgi:hypothetical protein